MPITAPASFRTGSGQLKPGGIPVLNRAHPLARGLLFYAYDTGLGFVIELVSGRRATVSVANATGLSPKGAGFKWVGSSVASFASDSKITAATGSPPYSFATAYFQTAGAANNASIFGRLANAGASAPFWNWNFSLSNGNSQPFNEFGQVNGSGQPRGVQSGDSAGNSFKSLVGVATSASTFSFYRNATLVGSLSGLVIQSVNSGDNINVGGGTNAFVYYGAFWNRALTVPEITQLNSDPYCFLSFPQDSVSAQIRGAIIVPPASTGIYVRVHKWKNSQYVCQIPT